MPLDEEDLSYASLVNRWRRERATTALTKMAADFYERFDLHLRELHAEYQKEQVLHPAAPKVLILLDELSNLQRVRDDLFDLREKKIVTAALIAARDGRPDRNQMTREEEALFDALLKLLREARRSLLRKEPVEAPKAAGGPPVPPETASAPTTAAQPASMQSAAPATLAEAPLVAPATVDRPVGPTRVLVRVKTSVEPFVAPDLRHYRLQAEDVAALPREVAHLLIQRGLAVALGG